MLARASAMTRLLSRPGGRPASTAASWRDSSAAVSSGGDAVEFTLPGLGKPFRVPALFLRDNDMSLASRSATSGQKLHDVLSLGAYAFERHVDSVEFVRSCELPAGVALSPFAFSTVREAQRRKDADADVCVVARISSSPLGSASAEEPAELEYAAPSDRMFLPDGSMAPRRVPEPFTAVVPLPWLRRWAAEAADSEACDIAGAYARAAAAKAADVPAWPILETTAPPGQPRAETAHEDTLDSRVGPTLWSGPSVAAAGPEAAAQGAPTAFHSWDEVVASAEGHARWLGSIRSLGFAVLRGAPVGPDTVTRVNHLFGPVRETAEYGSVFDVRVEEDVWNFTFNSDGLDVHSDNPYRDPSPTVQLLNCVIAAKSGGETMLVDAWRAAQDLGAEDPEALAILAATPLSFEFKVSSVFSAALQAARCPGRVAASHVCIEEQRCGSRECLCPLLCLPRARRRRARASARRARRPTCCKPRGAFARATGPTWRQRRRPSGFLALVGALGGSRSTPGRSTLFVPRLAAMPSSATTKHTLPCL